MLEPAFVPDLRMRAKVEEFGVVLFLPSHYVHQGKASAEKDGFIGNNLTWILGIRFLFAGFSALICLYICTLLIRDW